MAKTLRVEIVGDSSSLQRALNRASTASTGFGSRMSAAGKSISATGAAMTKKLTLPIVAAAAVSVKFAADFQSSMEQVHTQAGASQQEVDKLSKSVLKLAPAVGTGPEELAKGLFHLESQGLRGAKAMEALRIAAEGAKVGNADLEDVTNALGAAITVGIKGTENYSQAMGAMNAIVGSGDMHMQDLADAMGTQLVGQAKISGISITALGGALAVFGDANIRGAKAGTMLSQAIRVMGAGSKATDKELKKIGLSNLKLSAEMRSPAGLIGALTMLQKGMDKAGLSADQQAIFISRAFGGKQAAGIKLLLVQLDRLKKKTEEVGKGAHSFGDAWDAATKTSKFKFDQFKASMQSLGISFGIILMPGLTAIAGALAHLASAFQNLSPHMQKIISIGLIVAAAIGPLLGIFGGLVTAIGGVGTALMFLAANPVVLAVAAIVALGAAIAAAVIWPDKMAAVLERLGLSAQRAQQVVTILQGVFADLRAVFEGAIAFILALWSRFGDEILSYLRATWENVKTYIQGAMMAIRGIIMIVSGLIHGDWSKVWDGIKLLFHGWGLEILAVARQVMALLQAAIRLGLDYISGFWKGVWRLLQGVASAAWNGIVGVIRGAIGAATSAAEAVGHGIVDGVGKGLHAIVATVKGGLDKIWGVISGVAKSAYNAATAIGAEIIHGIAAGITHAIGEAVGAIKHAGSAILSAGKSFLHINSPSLLFSQEIGSPIMEGIAHGIIASQGLAEGAAKQALQRTAAAAQAAQIIVLMNQYGHELGMATTRGIVMGLVQGTPSIVQQARQALQQATQEARQAVLDGKAGVRSAFEQMASEAFAAFDEKASAWKPKALVTLEKMQLQDQVNAAKQAIIDAQSQVDAATAQLNEDQAKGPQEGETPEQFQARIKADQDAVVQATKALSDAKRAQQELNLQLEADQEQKAHDKRMAKDREHLAKQLAQLEKFLLKHPEAWDTAAKRVEAILKTHEVPMFKMGEKIASQFGDGLAKGIKAVIKALQELSDHLPHSPAKKGPLSADLFKGGRDYGQMLVDGFASVDYTPVFGASFGSTRRGGFGASSGGGETHVHFHGPVYGDKDAIAAEVRKSLRSYGKNNAVNPLAFG